MLRDEPKAITILARDVSMELASDGHCAPLRCRLPRNLPPVSLFVSRSMADQPTMVALAGAVRAAAQVLTERIAKAAAAA